MCFNDMLCEKCKAVYIHNTTFVVVEQVVLMEVAKYISSSPFKKVNSYITTIRWIYSQVHILGSY